MFISATRASRSGQVAAGGQQCAQDAFLEKVMKLDAKKYAGVWIKKAFRDGSARHR